jgi:hypothetical protein
MALVQASTANRCGQCGRALLIPILRELPPTSQGGDGRSLARCARCGANNIMAPPTDTTAAQRAAAISFVTRGTPRLRR